MVAISPAGNSVQHALRGDGGRGGCSSVPALSDFIGLYQAARQQHGVVDLDALILHDQ